MVKSYLETLDYMFNPDVQLRFNKKNSRLYLDLNVKELTDNHFLIIDAFRIVDPQSETAVYNDHCFQAVYHRTNQTSMGTELNQVYWCQILVD